MRINMESLGISWSALQARSGGGRPVDRAVSILPRCMRNSRSAARRSGRSATDGERDRRHRMQVAHSEGTSGNSRPRRIRDRSA
jgi:hypothetical protein